MIQFNLRIFFSDGLGNQPPSSVSLQIFLRCEKMDFILFINEWLWFLFSVGIFDREEIIQVGE